jgi:hypothetical protein
MSTNSHQDKSLYQVVKPAPADSTEDYQAGWAAGDWYATVIKNLYADPSAGWSEEKANGFCDRLKLERG